jgi:hypothetical protein
MNLSSYILLIFTFLSLARAAYPAEVYDGFNSAKLSQIWSAKRIVPGALTLQHEEVRSGASAIAITVRPGDRFAKADGKSLASERAEISETRKLMSHLSRAYSYQFSIFIPQDFPIVSTRLVLAQWKQECPPRSTCHPDNPLVALRYVDGKLYVTVHADGSKQIVYQCRDDVRGQWLDLKFAIRFARGQKGFVKVWLGEKSVGEFNGPTAYSTAGGYPKNARFYFKMGLYRDVMNEPMTVYFDEYRKTDL